MKTKFDIAVIGGGASGLSLLYALHLQGILANYTVILIEPESKTSNDRTWSFWTDTTDPAWQMFSSTVSHRWSELDSAHNQRQKMDPYSYAQIRSKDFYRFINYALESYSNITRCKDSVKQLKLGEFAELDLSLGGKIEANLVFDSRPPKLKDPNLIWQSFVGYRISTKASFNAEVCTLMDFNVPQKNGLQFMYWLPTGADEGLIEFTRFGDEVLTEAESKPIIDAYLKKMGVLNYEVEEKEINKIPMTLSLNSAKKRHPFRSIYIPIGVRAGVVKASTGFAFKKIADHSWRIAQALKHKEAIPTAGHKAQFWMYDELLLRLFLRKNGVIKDIFVRLFKKHHIIKILRFLDEKSSFPEDLSIMYHMPWSPFFWSIGKSISARIRGRS
jgi:lycopene beta-cyclase